MKEEKIEYYVVNVFSEMSESEHKERVNKSIRTLCTLDIEKSVDLDYNMHKAFHDSVSTSKKGGTQ